MNWPLFWALILAFGFIIGNLMLLKHAAKFRLPNKHASISPTQPADKPAAADDIKHQRHDQKQNTPE